MNVMQKLLFLFNFEGLIQNWMINMREFRDEYSMPLREYYCASYLALLVICASPAFGEDEAAAGGGENASNPLASVTNTDVRLQYLDLTDDRGRVNDLFVDGAFMVNPKLKIKYELHYWETNVTGTSQSGLETAVLKAIYFPKQGVLDSGTKYKVAIGLDLIVDFGNHDKGIGMGADQLAPFVGIALSMPSGLTLIPLTQQFLSISGEDVNITAARLIALQPLAKQRWLKADLIVPYDWETDTIPAQAELQYGVNVNQQVALYVDGMVGIGHDRIFDWGVGVGLRIKY